MSEPRVSAERLAVLAETAALLLVDPLPMPDMDRDLVLALLDLRDRNQECEALRSQLEAARLEAANAWRIVNGGADANLLAAGAAIQAVVTLGALVAKLRKTTDCEASGSGLHNWQHSDEFTEKGKEYDGWCNTCGSSAGAIVCSVQEALLDSKEKRTV